MKAQTGFSLIELAIVLVIVTLLIGGLAVPLSAQIEARRIAETRKIMEEAREALMGYAMTHSCSCAYDNVGPSGILLSGPTTTCTATSPIPCPANNPSTNSTTLRRPYLPCPDTDGNGIENPPQPRSAECDQPSGYFPWRDLGTASQDAWGNRLRYEVTDPYSDASKGFSNTSTGNIQICGASGCTVGNVANNVPVVLVSYGPNGWGALNINGNTLAAPTSAAELENTNPVTTNSIYVSRIPSKAGTTAGEFDDLVTWISTPLLISRVCSTPGGCP